MELNLNKENIRNNYQKFIINKKDKLINGYLNLNKLSKINEIKIKKIDETYIKNNYNQNNCKEDEEDLDIELCSISKIIPINNIINIDEIRNIEKENIFVNKKSKVKRAPSINSFFDDISIDSIQTNMNNNNITNSNINNEPYQNFLNFNMTNYGLANRPENKSNNIIEKDDIQKKTNNNININIINDNKNSLPKKRHNSVIPSNINNFLDIDKETNLLDNTNITSNNYNNSNNEEIQKLKKDNKRLILKNNELSLKIKMQETKTKINSNNNNPKKFSSQREEYFLQKIKKLENEIIKQKDLIIKLTYNKRFNIGIRKIRVNSILIKGNANKLKRKNSINNIVLNNLYCNNNNYKNNYLNKTLSNQVNNNKYIRKKSQNIKTNKEVLSLNRGPSFASISSSPKRLEKKQKNNCNIKNNDMNKTMVVYNKNNSINLKLDNFKISKNIRNYKKIKELKTNKLSNNSLEEKIINEEDKANINKACGDKNIYKQLGPHKTCGKTSLIMSVINDNLFGNFNLSQYLIEHCNKNNTEVHKKLNIKRNSFN